MRADLGFYIKRLRNNLERISYQYYDSAGHGEYSLMNLWIVDYLYDNRDRQVFPRDIEEEFFITRATVSKMLNLMEEKGLIARRKMAEDGRLKQILLLPAGEALRQDAQKIRSQIEERITRNLSEEEQGQFRDLCRKILKGMEETQG